MFQVIFLATSLEVRAVIYRYRPQVTVTLINFSLKQIELSVNILNIIEVHNVIYVNKHTILFYGFVYNFNIFIGLFITLLYVGIFRYSVR